MKNLYFFLIYFVITIGYSQDKGLWYKINNADISAKSKINRSNIPLTFSIFKLELTSFKNQIVAAPIRGEHQNGRNHIIELPNAEGQLERFIVFETPIMEKELEEKFPIIKSYAAQGIDDPTAVARFTVTQFGLHCMILSGSKSTVFIDPYTEDRENYIVYDRKSLGDFQSDFSCLMDENISLPSLDSENLENRVFNTNDKKLRTYRLAQSCTGEYGTIFKGIGTIAQQKANVQAQMAITMTRVNGVYEKDLAITMVFVANNDLLIYLDAATDPWITEWNTMTAQTIDAIIGVNNYDIGHNFNTTGGGNAGCIGCVCSSVSQTGNHKGRGYTGRANPTGDAFDIDYVAHEMGHQFGGYHTQSNNSCRSGFLSEVEPGSATTIMGYAGICAANVQSNSDDYFAYVNIRDILLNVKFGVSSSCAQITNFSNNPPSVNAGQDYTIPKSTPFILTAIGSDPDGNVLTYCWEQRDSEAVLPAAQNNVSPTSVRTAGPMFRSLLGNLSNSRFFPNLPTVLTGATSNTWEVIPSVARTLNFSVVARDNVAGGGQTASDLMVVNVNAVAGPFVVNIPNTVVSWQAGTNQSVTWNVAGTTANGVNCAFVDIYLSTNGGTSFPILLASKVPNDGIETITIPNIVGTNNRIMVRGNNNIFYDVSNTNFSITAPSSTFGLAFSGIKDEQNKGFCQGATASYILNYSALGGFNSNTTFSVIGNPVGSTVVFSPATISTNGVVVVTVSNTLLCVPGFYSMTITGTSGVITKNVNLYLDLLNSGFTSMALTSPLDLSYAHPTSLTLNWVADVAATSYDVQVATDSAFTNIISAVNVINNSYLITGLVEITNYYWRVLPKNIGCSGSFSVPYQFATGQKTCISFSSTNIPIAISAAGTSTINSTLTIPIPSNVTISNVSITANITHTWTSDLTLTLISPLGTQVQLITGQCDNNDNINATFDDTGTTLICGINPAIVGTIMSQQLLSALNGQSSQGVWTLRVFDNANGDGGSLNSWSLNICTIPNVPLTCGLITSTWNGSSWSNGVPTNAIKAIISGNYDTAIHGNLQACKCLVNSGNNVIVNTNNYFYVDSDIVNNGNIQIENTGSLMQFDDFAVNTGSITAKRNTTPMLRYDYTYWSSPVIGQTLFGLSPLTLSDKYFQYNPSIGNWQSILNTTIMLPGKGYIIRAPQTFDPITPTVFNGVFTGAPNNGIIQTPISVGVSNMNLIGNPYPSAISANAFLSLGINVPVVEGTIYLWTHNTPITNYIYNSNDFAVYNFSGSVSTKPATSIGINNTTPTGKIASGQGFFIKGLGNGQATFKNSMRLTTNNDEFFRTINSNITETEIEKNRLWLNLTNSQGLFKQLMIGYIEGATDEYDRGFDGEVFNGNNYGSFYSIVNNLNLAIQGKALTFNENEIIPLGYNVTLAGNFEIEIDNTDGFMSSKNIYLHDKLLNIIHDLKQSSYSFFTEIETFNNRFELRYNEILLNTNNFITNENQLFIAVKDKRIEFLSKSENINQITIYDVLGRIVYNIENLNTKNYSLDSMAINPQTLLVKLKLENGETVIKKIVF